MGVISIQLKFIKVDLKKKILDGTMDLQTYLETHIGFVHNQLQLATTEDWMATIWQI